jgi:asparagine synthetase B (glutamine-hydrolysing)
MTGQLGTVPSGVARTTTSRWSRVYGFGSIYAKTLRDSRLAIIIVGGLLGALLLSSGVDSTLLAALLAKHGMRPETFTFRYTHYEGKYNESPGARRAAQHCSLGHRDMPVGPEDVAKNLEDVLLRHHGPMTYGLHTAILKDVADSGAKVLYSG